MRQLRERLGRLLFGAVTYAARRRARAVQRLAAAAGAGRPVTALVDTGTRVDTGAWGCRARLCVCLLADELLLLVGRERAVLAAGFELPLQFVGAYLALPLLVGVLVLPLLVGDLAGVAAQRRADLRSELLDGAPGGLADPGQP